MSVSIETAETWWREAQSARPLVIIGAGRWGRVWADVASGARGSGDSIFLVARSNTGETQSWRADAPRLAGLAVSGSVTSAIEDAGGDATVIVASRPRDHAQDMAACIDARLPALVEKPFLSAPSQASGIVREARSRGVLLGIAAEFSLLPELHVLAGHLGDWAGEVLLEWGDPVAEVRYGAAKRVHDEAPMLGDLLSHAFSVFEVLAPRESAEPWRMLSAEQTSDGGSGELELSRSGIRYRFVADKAAARRRRLLRVDCEDGRAFELDFTETPARLSSRQGEIVVPARWSALASTLRLELGAWFCAVDGKGELPAIVTTLDAHVALAGQLADKIGWT